MDRHPTRFGEFYWSSFVKWQIQIYEWYAFLQLLDIRFDANLECNKCGKNLTLYNLWWDGLIIQTSAAAIHPKENKAVLEPWVSPAFAITYFCNHCNIRFENTSKCVNTLTFFSKNLNQRSLTPRWPLTPCLLRSHVRLYPRIIVSKSHDNTSMYVDTVINFAKYHIHTTYIHTTYIYYVQNEWSHSLLLNSVQARQLDEDVPMMRRR